MPHVIISACTRCGACLSECPTGSIAEGKRQYLIDTDTCDDHATCVNVCPVNAILPQQTEPAKPRAEGRAPASGKKGDRK